MAEMTMMQGDLLEACAASEVHRKVFEIIRQRERGRTETSAEVVERWFRAAAVEKNVHAKVLAFLRELEKANAGKLVVGRRDHPTRFRWFYDMRQVARAALGEAALVRGLRANGGTGVAGAEPGSNTTTMMLAFPLREHFTLELQIPKDLSVDEAERIAQFVRSLPMRPPLGAPSARRSSAEPARSASRSLPNEPV